jgi:hypothetical protein
MKHLRRVCLAVMTAILSAAAGTASAQPAAAGLEFSGVVKPDGTGWQFGYYTRTPTHTTSSLDLTDMSVSVCAPRPDRAVARKGHNVAAACGAGGDVGTGPVSYGGQLGFGSGSGGGSSSRGGVGYGLAAGLELCCSKVFSCRCK